MDANPLIRKLLPAKTSGVLRDFIWRQLGIKVTLRTRLPVEVRSLSDWVVFADIFVNEEYDEAIERAFSTSGPGERIRILDAGANVGFFALRCLDIASRRGVDWKLLDLTLVEGSSEVFEDLTSRIPTWGDAAGVIRMKQGLAGLHEGSAVMESADMHCMNHVSEKAVPGRPQVAYVDLRPYFSESTVVHLLKCDIEGSELLFLETYARELCVVRAIVIELHHDKCDTRRCLEILSDAGFVNSSLLREEPTFTVMSLWR